MHVLASQDEVDEENSNNITISLHYNKNLVTRASSRHF